MNLTAKALRHGTRCRRILQFYLSPTHLSTNGMNHTCLCLPSRSWSSFTDPEKMKGWVGLDTTTVSNQSLQDCYVTAITVVSCSNRHALQGNWSAAAIWASNSWCLGPRAATLTTEPPSQHGHVHHTTRWSAFQLHCSTPTVCLQLVPKSNLTLTLIPTLTLENEFTWRRADRGTSWLAPLYGSWKSFFKRHKIYYADFDCITTKLVFVLSLHWLTTKRGLELCRWTGAVT